ncbi:GNAT family N-acetyltransferase [Streptomyces sp. TRM64462]|uniref:GNAT family N-acetyltransferase n=1 Tax=Streptomyces sp. TRM64462 TaxID=2741726 RepID=UPI001585DB17|nr:GNAT family N-acetyltransferase [Streptomyces sp. TRM64462]
MSSASATALRLEEITPDNVLDACALRVHPLQEKFVAPVARSLAEAYASPGIAWPRLIMDGDELVGFVMAFFDVRFDEKNPDDRPRSGLWRLNIAATHQGCGYGRFAVEAVAEEIRRRGGTRITVTWKPGEHGPEEFYRTLGFEPTGEMSEDELVGEMDIAPLP